MTATDANDMWTIGNGKRSTVNTSRTAVTGMTALAMVASGPLVGAIVDVSPASADPAPTDLTAETETEAVALAQETGDPVEILALRGETRDVFANPDGTFTANEHVAPVRTITDGEWVGIDTTLHLNADGTVSPASTTLDLVFSGGGDTDLVKVSENGRNVEFDWPTTLPAPSIDGDTAVYLELMPDVDLHVTALPDGFTHTLIVKTAVAAANPDLVAIHMPITTDGVTVTGAADGGLQLTDTASGGLILNSAAPTMWDAQSTQAPVDTEVDSDSVTIIPDRDLLENPDTQFPVAIDLVYRDDWPSSWAMIDSGYPSQSYYKFPGTVHEGLGYCPGLNGCAGSLIKRLLYKVPTSAYKGKDIISAQFAVTVEHFSGSSASHQVELYKMPSGISTSTTWNSKADEWAGNKIDTRTAPSVPSDECRSNDSSTAMEFDVKPEMEQAASAGTSALTFGLRNTVENDSANWMRMCENGILRVHYNTPPAQPDTAEMGMNPGKACTYELGSDTYTRTPPTLFGTLRDADHGLINDWNDDGGRVSEQLQAQFKLLWGTGQEWTSPLSPAKASGSQFSMDLALESGLPTLPTNAPIGWIMRAYDGESYSAWSWSGDASRCRFIIDPTKPLPPVVTSTDFPDGDVVTPAVGEDGTLSIDTGDDDIASYTVDFNKDESGPVTIEPSTPGGPANAVFRPELPGRHLMTVVAADAAGNSSTGVYSFKVSVPDAISSFALSDPVGSTTVVEDGGENPGTAGPGVTFGIRGPGALTAADFNGTSSAYISTNVRGIVRTDEAFAASAWVRVDALNRDQTIVSVDGSGEAGFILGYRSTSATTGAWMLQIPDTNVEAFNHWRVTGGVVNEANRGEWVHVAGVYDNHDRKMYLYVNGQLVGQGERKSSWRATNAIQIGRSYDAGLRGRYLDGALADVRVFDRFVAPDETGFLATVLARRAAYWQLNSGTSEYLGGASLTLTGNATVVQPGGFDPPALVGDGHLELDGVTGYASTPSELIDSRSSFSITGRARPVTDNAVVDMAVFALPGNNTDLVKVQYSAQFQAWQLIAATSDSASAETVTVTNPAYVSDGSAGQAIAVTYDASTGQLRLWVDGVASDPLIDPFTTSWQTTGIRVGLSSATTDYFAGAIDDVRVYAGSCHHALIRLLATRAQQPSL